MKKIKLSNILCSVNFLVMLCGETDFSALYTMVNFSLLGMYCTQHATIPSSKHLVTSSEVPICTAQMPKTPTLCIRLQVHQTFRPQVSKCDTTVIPAFIYIGSTFMSPENSCTVVAHPFCTQSHTYQLQIKLWKH
jgi:hypothetical protein